MLRQRLGLVGFAAPGVIVLLVHTHSSRFRSGLSCSRKVFESAILQFCMRMIDVFS